MRSGVRILLLAAAAALCFTLAGCEKKNDSGGQESSSSSAPDSSANPSTVSVKKYTFPEFMRSQKEPDMLSREVYKSFDKDSGKVGQPIGTLTIKDQGELNEFMKTYGLDHVDKEY